MTDIHKTGRDAENDACAYLEKKGLHLLERNYRCHFGEIDLIMQDKQDIVFVEVRARQQTHYGDAIETIDDHKQSKLIKTAIFYLQKKHWLDKVNCRFDVVGKQIELNQLEWIQDAFSTDFF